MLCKFHYTDPITLHHPSPSTKPTLKHNKNHNRNIIPANPDGQFKTIPKLHSPSHPTTTIHPVINPKHTSNPQSSFSDAENINSGCTHYRSVWIRGKGKVREENTGRNPGKGEMQTRCSTKCREYGGCVSEMLEALERVRDVDEALGPWEGRIGNKERSIMLKEQVRWERAMEIFEWFKRKGCYKLNVIHYNIMIRVLGRAKRWGELEVLLGEMKEKRIGFVNSTFGTLIDVYSKGGKRGDALAWLRKMDEVGMEPDEMTMGTVVQLYKKAGEFEKGEQFFKKWSWGNHVKEEAKNRIVSDGFEAQPPLSLYTYNTLIDTYGKAGQLQEASETFNLMLRDGVVPDTITFNTMIHVYGNHGGLEEVNSIMRKMEELGCPPDTRTYNILISLYAKHNDIDRAVGYFMRMKEACLEPDIVSYRTLLYAFSIRHMVGEAEKLVTEMDKKGLRIDEYTQTALTRMYIEAGMLEKSWLWFQRFHLKGNMSSECYSANIDAYGEHGHVLVAEKAFEACKKMRKLGVLEYNVMIKAYGIGKSYDKACMLFDSMDSEGVIPDRCSYVSLIQMLAAADLPHIAKRYLLKLQEAGFTINCIPYSAVISSFAKLGYLEDAKGLYEAMVRNGVEADVIVYGVLINAFAVNGDAKEALVYADAMRNAGLPLNSIICNSLIKLYTKLGYLQEAEEMYKLLVSLEGNPDVYSSNCMIDLYSERSMAQEAENVFEDMRLKGYANEFSFAMMLCMYKKMGRLQEAMRIGKEMRDQGLLTELQSYNSMISLFVMMGKFREAVALLQEMIDVDILPDVSSFKSLGDILVRSGISKRVVSMLEVTWKRDTHSGTQAWISALASVIKEGDTC